MQFPAKKIIFQNFLHDFLEDSLEAVDSIQKLLWKYLVRVIERHIFESVKGWQNFGRSCRRSRVQEFCQPRPRVIHIWRDIFKCVPRVDKILVLCTLKCAYIKVQTKYDVPIYFTKISILVMSRAPNEQKTGIYEHPEIRRDFVFAHENEHFYLPVCCPRAP